ncbi:MAG: YidC/Oxa1 family membrane protein insertase [Candidatus Saccharimonadales bacterium]
MFTTFIVKPLFNILIFIYAILPGHNFGLALIIFTILFRIVLWPLVKKQLHQAKAMRKLQPELAAIKKKTKGDKQKEGQLIMELYKEKGVKPLGTLPTLIIQLIILWGLYDGLRKIISNNHQIISFSYTWVQHLPWMKHLAANIHNFDNTLFGIVNLSRSALSSHGVYWPAMVIVVLSAVSQYYQSKQLLPTSKDQKSLRQIMKEASSGVQADQGEVSAAVGKSTQFLLPIMIFFFTVEIASALSLYWLTSGVVAYVQQRIALREDEEEMEEMADKPKSTKDVSKVKEAEIVEKPALKSPKPNISSKRKKSKKRKKR